MLKRDAWLKLEGLGYDVTPSKWRQAVDTVIPRSVRPTGWLDYEAHFTRIVAHFDRNKTSPRVREVAEQEGIEGQEAEEQEGTPYRRQVKRHARPDRLTVRITESAAGADPFGS